MAIIGISGKKNSGKDTIALIIQWLTDDLAIRDKLTFEEWKRQMKELKNTGHGYHTASEWKIVKFADKIKTMVCTLIGCSREQLEDHVFKETALGSEWDKYGGYEPVKDFSTGDISEQKELTHMTPRLMLQLLGTNFGRDIIHPDIWVTSTMLGYKKGPHNGPTRELRYPNWIIPDTRFLNEVEAIKDRDGIVIRVNRLYQTVEGQGNGNWATFGKEQFHESETALDDYKDFDYVIDNGGSVEDLTKKVEKVLKQQKMI